MRISDWSSDVCSSDLLKVRRTDSGAYFPSWREAADKDPVAKAIVDSYYKRPAEELYDLKADPDEKVNLAGDPRYAKQLAELRSRLAAWRKADRKSTRLNQSLMRISYAVFCLKKKTKTS